MSTSRGSDDILAWFTQMLEKNNDNRSIPDDEILGQGTVDYFSASSVPVPAQQPVTDPEPAVLPVTEVVSSPLHRSIPTEQLTTTPTSEKEPAQRERILQQKNLRNGCLKRPWDDLSGRFFLSTVTNLEQESLQQSSSPSPSSAPLIPGMRTLQEVKPVKVKPVKEKEEGNKWKEQAKKNMHKFDLTTPKSTSDTRPRQSAPKPTAAKKQRRSARDLLPEGKSPDKVPETISTSSFSGSPLVLPFFNHRNPQHTDRQPPKNLYRVDTSLQNG